MGGSGEDQLFTRREIGGREDLFTRREDDGHTRRDGDGIAQREGAGTGYVRVTLPPELAKRFSVVGELAASGAEADVVLVEDHDARPRVLKLYRRGISPDEGAIAKLATAERAHVVEVVDRGWAEGCWFEVLEYCVNGSLRTLLDEGEEPNVTDVVRETSTALAHVHELGLVHRDLKPENLLVRTMAPFDLVLGDFGLVRQMDASVRWTRAWGTPAYSPPELEGGEVSAAWDWWSLGMIVAEVAGGRHPFALPDGSMMAEPQVRSWLAQRPVDLSAVEDERVLLLCRGLLTRDRRHRWGAQQVEAWLDGATPAVVADRPTQSGGRARTVLFAGQDVNSPEELAGAFQDNWSEAMRRLFQERDATLVEETERMLRQHELDEAVRLLAVPLDAASLPRRFANLLAEMDPELEPVYDGVRVTPAGLEAAAVDVIRAGGNSPIAKTLDEIRRQNILTAWRDLPGMSDGAHIQEQWIAAQHELEAAAEEITGGGSRSRAHEGALGRAWLIATIVDPGHQQEQLTHLVESLDGALLEECAWWTSLQHNRNEPLATILRVITSPAAETEVRERRLARERHERERQEARRQTKIEAREGRAHSYRLCSAIVCVLSIGEIFAWEPLLTLVHRESGWAPHLLLIPRIWPGAMFRFAANAMAFRHLHNWTPGASIAATSTLVLVATSTAVYRRGNRTVDSLILLSLLVGSVSVAPTLLAALTVAAIGLLIGGVYLLIGVAGIALVFFILFVVLSQ